MKKRSVYNPGFAQDYRDRKKEDIVLGEDNKFENTIEARIFNIKSGENKEEDADFQTVAFLCNFKVVNVYDEDGKERTALMLVFQDRRGRWFTCYQKYNPYFLIKCKIGYENDVIGYMEKVFQNQFEYIKIIDKVDLSELNHLSGQKRRYLQVNFSTLTQCNIVKRQLQQKLNESQNKYRPKKRRQDEQERIWKNQIEAIEELYEHDISYSSRVCIDKDIRVSYWYDIKVQKQFVIKMQKREDFVEKPEFTILAFDIETTKAPLKFPDPDIDCIILISYVIDEQAFLIVNREVCSQDITPFNYNPKDNINTDVIIYNEQNEKKCLEKFFQHIKQSKPFLLVTFNGDFFDIPFIKHRAQAYDMELIDCIGLEEQRNGSYIGKYIFLHMDCFYWVKRDAFLPHGSHGLKAVTKKKLGYSPIEVDPEDMVEMAKTEPQKLCEYSVSDAVATYYLYMQNIHDYIFALCTIIPMNPDDVLRRGSGTLCENLLMARAYQNEIVFPNKQKKQQENFYKGHLIENQTYVGGYVECLNNGVYRADIETKFKLNYQEYNEQIEKVQKVLEFFVKVEKGLDLESIENINEVRESIQNKLQNLSNKIQEETIIETMPLIYHIDVSSMYPNIILTNRLQPTAIVNDKICSNCVFNEPKNNCKRRLGWDWKVTYYPITQPEYEKLKFENDAQNLKKAIKTYSQKHYKTMHQQKKQYKENVVCMRENPFYVDTIRDFRDRRIRFKVMASKYKKIKRESEENQMLAVYYDSLQLAYKIILNSFYGYVMKKGARWYSMEMAAMVTFTGAKIIQESRKLMDLLGKPLELDTDGIWTLLPQNFPENFELKCKNGKVLQFSYPCSLMNWIIYDKFKNTQYQTLKDKEDRTYNIKEEMSIFFEIDGPYKAIVIPAAREENKKLKKRYCVFDFKGNITEIKGFEIKRRGELGIVKNFQEEIFNKFLQGKNLNELYQACADTARKWLKVITEKGQNMSIERILELLGQLKVLSRSLQDYSNKKSVAITAAQRLFEIMGTELGDTQGLNCNFIISKKPESAQLSQRAIPIMVFQLSQKKRNEYLRKWLQVNNPEQENLVTVLDWDYYYDRFIHIVQKIVTIPAILQGLENPMPEILQPDWLEKKVYKNQQKEKQSNLQNYFEKIPKTIEEINELAREKQDDQIQKIQQKKIKENENQIQEISYEIKSLKLAVLKKKWKEERQQKKQFSLDQIQMKTEDLQAYTQQLEQRVRKVPWQILSIEQIENGWLKYWILIDNKVLIDRKIHAHKKIYVNSFEEDNQGIGTLSKKSLPQEKPQYYLYEYLIDDQQYKDQVTMLDYYSTSPLIEGVYETQVNLQFRSIVQNGNYCKLKTSGNKSNKFEIEELQKQIGQTKVLFQKDIFKNNISILYLWGIEIKDKYLLMLFSENQLTVFKYQNHKEQKKVGSQYKNFIKETVLKTYGKQNKIFNIDYLKIDYQFCETKSDFESLIQNYILDYKTKFKNQAFITIVDSKIQSLNKQIEQMKLQIPLLILESENQLDQVNYSSLDWHFVLIELGLNNFRVLEQRLNQLDKLSTFCEIPICQLDNTIQNSIIKSIDICFARELDKNFCVWWYSNNYYPDIGLSQDKQSIEDIVQSKDLQCEFSRQFISDNFVIEIDIGMFYFNALICSEDFQNINTEIHLQKKQDKKYKGFFQKSGISNNIGFKVLKDLFLNWYRQVSVEKNETANLLLQNIVRWLCSPQSYFFDPLLKEHLDKIVKKFFDEFIQQLEEMGGIIIYASPHKIFISTKKYSYHQAYNFIQFILKSLVQNNKFQYLLLKIIRVYKLLIFKDQYNLVGVTVEGEDEEGNDKNVNLYQNWRIKEYFPIAIQNYFDQIFKSIMSKFYEYLRESIKIPDFKQKQKLSFLYEKMEQYLTSEFMIQMQELVQYIKQQERLNEINKLEDKKVNKILEKDQDDYEKDSFLVDDQEDLDGGMFAELERKQKKIESDNESIQENQTDWDYPDLPGKKIKYEYLVQEFMHILFQILKVNRHYMYNIFNNLQKELIENSKLLITQQIHKDESYIFQFYIYDIICDSCYLVKNINIFQEYNIKNKQYNCVCGYTYDKFYIQSKIINLLKTCHKNYMYPQIYCKDCKRRKYDYLQNKCYCSGRYQIEQNEQNNEYVKELNNNFENFKKLSILCDFEMLNSHLKNYNVQLNL